MSPTIFMKFCTQGILGAINKTIYRSGSAAYPGRKICNIIYPYHQFAGSCSQRAITFGYHPYGGCRKVVAVPHFREFCNTEETVLLRPRA